MALTERNDVIAVARTATTTTYATVLKPTLFLRRSRVLRIGDRLEPLDFAFVDRQLQCILIGRRAVPVLDACAGPPRLPGTHLLNGTAAHLRARLPFLDHQELTPRVAVPV